MDYKIKVMIVDDSAVIRNIVTKILSKNENIEVVGTAINGKFALQKLNKLQPDIIILDLEMPEMNGIEFLKEKEKLNIKTPVIILSSHAKKGAKITIEALSLGASDFILKPSEPGTNIDQLSDKLIEMVLALAKPKNSNLIINQEKIKIENIEKQSPDLNLINKNVTNLFQTNQIKFEISNHLQPIKSIPDIKIISIGISTGGPNALRDILPLFPKDFPVPIVIVQHMPAGFTFEFANSLNKICNLNVKEAENNDIIKPGRILICPGNKHIRFLKKSLAIVAQLDEGPLVNGHRPSADILFESTAEVYGENSLGIIMTGMGKDGANNIGLILKKGGITIAQDQETSVVFGMPKVAIEKNNIQLVLPLKKIPETVIDIVINKKIKNIT